LGEEGVFAERSQLPGMRDDADRSDSTRESWKLLLKMTIFSSY